MPWYYLGGHNADTMFILQVVDFLDCESGLPLSGILQPLTSVCGVISVISSHFLVMFEKLFLWNDKMTMLDRKNTKSVGAFKSSLREFRCKVASKPVEQTMYPEVLIRLIGSHKNPQGKWTTPLIIIFIYCRNVWVQWVLNYYKSIMIALDIEWCLPVVMV